MPGCVLRAYGAESGADFDVNEFLSASSISPCRIAYRGKGRHLTPSKASRASGFNLVVSEADGEHVPTQIQDAIKFLVTYREELLRLRNFPGVASIYFDFGWDFPSDQTSGQSNRFPLDLLSECSALGVEIEVSVYTTAIADKIPVADKGPV